MTRNRRNYQRSRLARAVGRRPRTMVEPWVEFDNYFRRAVRRSLRSWRNVTGQNRGRDSIRVVRP